MIAYLVVEGEADASLLKRLLPAELLHGVEIVVAGSVSEMASLARTLLVTRRRPVAVVLETDAVKPEFVHERRQNMEDLLYPISAGVPCKVVLAVPHLEAIFFETQRARQATQKLAGQPVSDLLLLLARSDPAAALQELTSGKQLRELLERIDTLNAEDLAALRSTSVLSDLIRFLRLTQEREGNGAGKREETPAAESGQRP
jgi:hypothetical protein